MRQWASDGAALLTALLDCASSEEAHDLIVNHSEEFSDLVERLEALSTEKD